MKLFYFLIILTFYGCSTQQYIKEKYGDVGDPVLVAEAGAIDISIYTTKENVRFFYYGKEPSASRMSMVTISQIREDAEKAKRWDSELGKTNVRVDKLIRDYKIDGMYYEGHSRYYRDEVFGRGFELCFRNPEYESIYDLKCGRVPISKIDSFLKRLSNENIIKAVKKLKREIRINQSLK